MNRFIHELRERGVIRVAALYGAFVWLLLQGADVLFPAFNIPESGVAVLVIASGVCLPFVLAFAWFYELTDKGIQREEEVRHGDAHRLMMGNEMYFIAIGILAVALSISVYMNFRHEEPVAATPHHAPVSVLISDFNNETGDPIFAGSVEQALGMGIEGASFINSFPRARALQVAAKLKPGDSLDADRARLVAVREGISLVLVGTIKSAGQGVEMDVNAIDPRSGKSITKVTATSSNKLDVLQAVAKLADQIRSALGDVNIKPSSAVETFSTNSLRAVSDYTHAQRLAHAGRDEEAVAFYKKAVQVDPKFGRAYSGWALSEFQLGRNDQAKKLWKKTLTLLNDMTDRERYRTLGLYYSNVTHDYEQAIENYSMLVKQYPADAIGHNNLAVDYFMTRQFKKALQAGKKLLEIYPKEPIFRSNYALYAMYAGDFDTARTESQRLLASDQSLYKAYLPLAIARLHANDIPGARKAYTQMAQVNARGASVAVSGLADIALIQGDYKGAVATLKKGIASDTEKGMTRFRAAKYIALAEAYLRLGEKNEARETIGKALVDADSDAELVPAALMYVQMGDVTKAEKLEHGLGQQLQSTDRAYAMDIKAAIALRRGQVADSVDDLRTARDRADLWLVHFSLGKAYLHADHYAAAMSEFDLCRQRLGEATALFLDDMPTYHYAAELDYWRGRTQQELGMTDAATHSLQTFLSRRKQGDTDFMTRDARRRLTKLADSASGSVTASG